MLNKVIAIGNLGKDPEMKYTQNGNGVVSFSVATSRTWKDKATGERKEETEWLNCEAWSPLAEIINQYGEKGKQVYIEGRLKTDKYEKNGETRYSTRIVVDQYKMLGRKSDSEGRASGTGTPAAEEAMPF